MQAATEGALPAEWPGLNATSWPCPSGNPGNYCHPPPNPYSGTSGDFYHLKVIEDILYIIVTPGLCIFGCIGNLINILVLTRIRARIRKVDGGKEGVTHLGLMLLAISDLLFCLSICPRGFSRLSSTMSFFPERTFGLYYQAYGTGFVTTFILTSTWVTVAMAVLRYVGICHPLAMRRIDSRMCSRVAYSLVILLSLIINLPAFWQFQIVPLPTQRGEMAYLIDIGFFSPGSVHGHAFLWVRACYAVFIPAALLAFCNLSLILTLRQSHEMRRACRVQDSASRNSSRITLLLVVLVVMFVLLVFPSEVMDFCTENIRLDAAKTQTFLLIRAIANVLQVLNFAVNFVLYCIMNVHFRSAMRDLIFCGSRRRTSRDRSVRTSLVLGRSVDNSCSVMTTSIPSGSMARRGDRLSPLILPAGDDLDSTL